MTYQDSIQRPTLLLDPAKAKANIQRMAAKARENNVHFRPHFKTHQSAEIGQWFRDQGIEAITVSSIDMALAFAEAGWTDITIAFPVNLRQIETINQLAHTIKLGLLLESPETVKRLDKLLTAGVTGWLKIDAGYHRTGIDWQDEALQIETARAVADSEHIALKGILTHSGNTYGASSISAVQEIFGEAVAHMRQVQALLSREGYQVALSVGDTPGCTLAQNFDGIDEIRPGNFVFFDLMQQHIGACSLDDIAVALACPIVARHPQNGRIIIYGGAVHFSKEVLIRSDGSLNFGRVAYLKDDTWIPLGEDIKVIAISQEHGIIQADPDLMKMVDVGDVLAVLPVHSCLTVDLIRRYLTIDTGTWIDCIPKEG